MQNITVVCKKSKCWYNVTSAAHPPNNTNRCTRTSKSFNVSSFLLQYWDGAVKINNLRNIVQKTLSEWQITAKAATTYQRAPYVLSFFKTKNFNKYARAAQVIMIFQFAWKGCNKIDIITWNILLLRRHNKWRTFVTVSGVIKLKHLLFAGRPNIYFKME